MFPMTRGMTSTLRIALLYIHRVLRARSGPGPYNLSYSVVRDIIWTLDQAAKMGAHFAPAGESERGHELWRLNDTGRGSIVWPNARAWRAREEKSSVGSNPTLSAIKSPR
jgi:hypothetical protein